MGNLGAMERSFWDGIERVGGMYSTLVRLSYTPII